MPQAPKSSWVQCGRQFSLEEVEQIRETVDTFSSLSRDELSMTICEHLDWHSASGGLKTDACMKLLEKLEAEGCLKLPEKRTRPPSKRSSKPGRTERTAPRSPIEGVLGDVGSVGLEMVTEREETEVWNEFMDRYHYLGYKHPFGCYARYFIESELGKLGCLFFSGAAKSLGRRDRWVGWDEKARLSNLGLVLNNTRFLIFPWVRVKNLASHVLGRVSRRIEADWLQRWNYRPVLLETFVDPLYFDGTCYRAANWQYLGLTTGEGLVRKGRSYTTSPKKIFVKPLAEDFREVLCAR